MSTHASTTPRSSRAGPARLLTLDLGNTRAKLRAWTADPDAPPERTFELDLSLHGESAFPGLPDGLKGLPCALSSVAGADREEELVAELERRGHRVLRAPDPGLRIDCDPPEDVGRDRLYAARGGLGLTAGPIVVCDVGTALTVDLASREGDGEEEVRVFHGGAIAPGPALLARALVLGTARLPEVDPTPDPRPLGRSTHAAIRSGCVHGIRGAARELVLRLLDEVPEGRAQVFLTGGARELLLRPAPFLDRPLRVEPDLVHLGLFLAAREAATGC